MPDNDPKLSWRETLRVWLHIGWALVRLGVVVPKRSALASATAGNGDSSIVKFVAELRQRYPKADVVRTWFPFRSTLIALSPDAIDAALSSTQSSPDPFIKEHQLSRFIPGALVNSGNREADACNRRAFNTNALNLNGDNKPPPHAQAFTDLAAAEGKKMLVNRDEPLRYRDFESLAMRVSQQVIMGAGEIDEVHAAHLRRLDKFANFLVPVRHRCSYRAFYRRIDELLADVALLPAASLVREAVATQQALTQQNQACTPVAQQIGFWFHVLQDAIVIHVPRTLALIAAHPQVQADVRHEAQTENISTEQGIRNCVLLEKCIEEQLRLWTPVPVLLRRALEPFTLKGEHGDVNVAAKQQILVPAAAYHRDKSVFNNPNMFSPYAAARCPKFPDTYFFSAYGRECAGRTVVTFVLKAILAPLLARHEFKLVGPTIDTGSIPHLYNHFRIDLLALP